MSSFRELYQEIFPYGTFYHITDINNVRDIFQDKRILSNELVLKSNKKVHRIHDEEINNRRRYKLLKGPDKSYRLSDFVPFLMNPRGPFLKRVSLSSKGKSLVMLGFEKIRPNQICFHTDGNAATGSTKSYFGLDGIKENIDLKTIANKWEDITRLNTQDYRKKKRIHQSEVLLYRYVDTNDINHIVVSSVEHKKYLLNLRLSASIFIIPEMFFGIAET